MFSKSCEYGIRALTVIAEKGKDGRRLGIKEICKASNTPEPFTAKILQNLSRKDLIGSKKGPSGGFYMTRDLDSITLYEIVEAIDGDSIYVKCGLGLSSCNAKKPCPLHDKFEAIRSDLKAMCKENTLADLLTNYHGEVYLR